MEQDLESVYGEATSAVALGLREGLGRLRHDIRSLGIDANDDATVPRAAVVLAGLFAGCFTYLRFAQLNYMMHLPMAEHAKGIVTISRVLAQTFDDSGKIAPPDSVDESEPLERFVNITLENALSLFTQLRLGSEQADHRITHESFCVLRAGWWTAIQLAKGDDVNREPNDAEQAVVQESLEFFAKLYGSFGASTGASPSTPVPPETFAYRMGRAFFRAMSALGLRSS